MRADCPMLVLWGNKDPFTPVDGPTGKYFQALPSERPATSFRLIDGELRPMHSIHL